MEGEKLLLFLECLQKLGKKEPSAQIKVEISLIQAGMTIRTL